MPDWSGGSTHGSDSATNETTQEEKPMPQWGGGNTHGGDSATEETAQEKPMPNWGGGSTHGGDGATDEAEDATETVDAAHVTTNEETSAPNSD